VGLVLVMGGNLLVFSKWSPFVRRVAG
jgi:hypothetical protein